MNKRFIRQILTLILAFAISFTSVVPAYAMEPDEPGFVNDADPDDIDDDDDQEDPADPVDPADPADPADPVIPANTDDTDDDTKKTVSVTLNANGGLFDNGEDTYVISVEENSSISDLVSIPSKEGSEFTGWYYDAETAESVDLSSYIASEDIVLYAGYLEVVADNNYDLFGGNAGRGLTVDANGGIFSSGTETQFIYCDQYNHLATDAFLKPVREGFIFTGWYAEPECETLLSSYKGYYDLKEKPSAGTTIYAGWREDNGHTVTFVFGSENGTDPQDTGYYYDPVQKKNVNQISFKVPVGDNIAVAVDNNILDGTHIVNKNSNYALTTWYTDAARTKEIDKGGNSLAGYFWGHVPQEDETYYAKYEANKYVVTLHANDGDAAYFVNDTKLEYSTPNTGRYDSMKVIVNSALSDLWIDGSTIACLKNDDVRKTLVGWYNDAECTKPAIEATTGRVNISGDMNLYAKWETSLIRVTFDANGGWFLNEKDNTDTSNTSYDISTKTNENKEYWTDNVKNSNLRLRFMGWSTDKNATTPEIEAFNEWGRSKVILNVSEDTTYYAVWQEKYSLATIDAGEGSFTYYDGNDEERKTVSKAVLRMDETGFLLNKPQTLPTTEDPSVCFDGWYYNDKKLDNNLYGVSSVAGKTGDIVITAKYTTESYVLTLNANGGYVSMYTSMYPISLNEKGTIANISLHKGQSIHLGNANYLLKPYKDKVMIGWFYDPECTDPVFLDGEWFLTPDSDLTLYAGWGDSYDDEPSVTGITYVLPNGARNSSKNLLKFVIPAAGKPDKTLKFYQATMADRIFDGWYTDSSYENKLTEDGDVWTYTVSAGDEFPEGGITLYGKFAPDKTLTVNFHSNLSKDTKKTVTYKMSKDAETLLDPQAIFGKSIVTDQMAENFVEWIPSTDNSGFTAQQKVSDLISKYAKANTKVTIDLYAQWKDGAPYTVKFNAGEVADFDAHDFLGSDFYVTSDNDLIRYETVYPDQKLVLTGHEFVRKGYTLTGWSYIASNGKKTTIKPTATVVNLAKSGETVELTAIWKGPESYTLSYDLAGGKYTGAGKLPGKYTYGNPYTLPDASEMTKVGYTFHGWTAKIGDSNYSTTILGKGGEVESGNVTLTASWDINRYNFTFDPNGGWTTLSGTDTWIRTGEVYLNQWTLKNIKYSRPGYKFKNWSYVDDNGVTRTIAANGTFKSLSAENGRTVVVTANWDPVKYTISYVLGSGAKTAKAPGSYMGNIKGDGSDTLIPEPTRTGFEFNGWTLSQKGVAPGEETAAVIKVGNGYTLTETSFGNVILTANWKPQDYSIVIKDSNGDDVTPEFVAKTKYPYDGTIDFTGIAGEITKANVENGKSVKGFALNEKDANKGTAKYTLAKNFKISDLVKATKATDTITLYTVTEKEKFFLNAYNSVDGNRDNGSYRTYNYDQSRDYKVPTPSLTGFTFEGWSYLDDDTVKDLSELAIAGTDYVVDAKTKALTIKKHINSSDPFKNATLVAVFETKTYKVMLVPNAKDVKADNTENATVVPNAGVVFTVGENDLVSHSDDSAVLSGIEWRRSGYTLKGFSLTSKGATLDGGVNAKVGGLFSKADRNGYVKLYAIWDANTITVTYRSGADVFADTDEIKGRSDDDYKSGFIIHELYQNEDKKYTFGKAITPPTYKISGYKFLGWKLEGTNPNVTANAKGYVTKINANNTEDVVLTPELEEMTYKLSLSPNGGTYDGSNKTIVLEDKVRFSEDITPYLPEADKFEKAGSELNYYYYGVENSYLALTAKAPAKPRSYAEFTKWLVGNSASNGYLILASTKAVTLYPQWTGIKVDTPKNVNAKFNNNTKSMNVYWNDIYGDYVEYEVQYSTNPTFLFSVATKSVTNGFNNVTLNGLTGSRYYVRVRGIKKDSSDNRIVGAWSTTVSAVTDTVDYAVIDTYAIAGSNYTNLGSRRLVVGQNLVQALGTPGFKPSGYRFDGWYKDYRLTDESKVGESETVDLHWTYYAKYVPDQYTVSFVPMVDDGRPEDQYPVPIMVTYDSTYGKLPEITRKGCEFDGWYISGSNTRVTENTIVGIAKDHELYAKWRPLTYKINFDANTPADTTVTGKMAVLSRAATEIKELPANTYKATGYKFLGWKISQDSDWLITDKEKIKPEHLLLHGATADADNNITVYAQWEAIEYTLTFNVGWNKPSQTVKAHYGEKITDVVKNSVTMPDASEHLGYLFGHWYTDTRKDPFSSKVGNDAIVTGNKTYYAFWPVQLYNVHFNPRNGESIVSWEAKYGTNVYSIIDSIKKYCAETEAKLEANPEKVTDDDRKFVAEAMTALEPVNEGYTFGGWYTGMNGEGVKIDENTTLPNNSVTYYAYWIPVQ